MNTGGPQAPHSYRSAGAPARPRSCTDGGRTRPRRTRREPSRSDTRPPVGPARAAGAAATHRGRRRPRAESRVAGALQPRAILAFELEGRVLDVEVSAQAALELVEHRVRV